MKLFSEYLLIGTVISIIYMIMLLKKDGLLDGYKNKYISIVGDDVNEDTVTKLVVICMMCYSYFLWPLAAFDIICIAIDKYSKQ